MEEADWLLQVESWTRPDEYLLICVQRNKRSTGNPRNGPPAMRVGWDQNSRSGS